MLHLLQLNLVDIGNNQERISDWIKYCQYRPLHMSSTLQWR